jgi:hypothetical protein
VNIDGEMSAEKSSSIAGYAPFTSVLVRKRDLHGILRAEFRPMVEVILAD